MIQPPTQVLWGVRSPLSSDTPQDLWGAFDHMLYTPHAPPCLRRRSPLPARRTLHVLALHPWGPPRQPPCPSCVDTRHAGRTPLPPAPSASPAAAAPPPPAVAQVRRAASSGAAALISKGSVGRESSAVSMRKSGGRLSTADRSWRAGSFAPTCSACETLARSTSPSARAAFGAGRPCTGAWCSGSGAPAPGSEQTPPWHANRPAGRP